MPFITSANASELARLGNATKRLRAEQGIDLFSARRLYRVRAQLRRVDRMLMLEQDPAKLDRLAAASMRLSDQEFALANRPKPGLLKPTVQNQRRPARPEPTPSKPPSIQASPEAQKPLGASGVGEGGSV